jgi:hypothetical protein
VGTKYVDIYINRIIAADPIWKMKHQSLRFEVFMAVTMKKAVFWDVAPCRYGVNRRFGGTYPEDGGDTFLRNVG